jgi:hypothetical protein
MNIEFDTIGQLLEELRQGRIVILTNDANRLFDGSEEETEPVSSPS